MFEAGIYFPPFHHIRHVRCYINASEACKLTHADAERAEFGPCLAKPHPGGSAMKADRLRQLQQEVNDGKAFALEDCAALITEVWRLKTSLTGKEMEITYLRQSQDSLRVELNSMTEANRLLQAEADELKAVHGLPGCDLENRWSNCAVRLKKRELRL
jgi:hypothetical protein